MTTLDNRQLIDFTLAMGPVLLGHSHPEVMSRVGDQLRRGVLFGTTEGEHELASRIIEFATWTERVAFVSTGSEGTHLAIRIARWGTGRRLIVKFQGHYHGWIDPLFVNTQRHTPEPGADGAIPLQHSVEGLSATDDVLVARWNTFEDLDRLFAERGDEIAGVILEPVPMNFGTFLPDPDYMLHLRELTRSHGARLIFDEVLSGFRLARGGAAELLGVEPDLGVFAKAIANGFPIALVAGTTEAMAPITSGPVVPAGTYSGNSISVAAALATLEVLDREGSELYPRLRRLGERLGNGIRSIATQMEVPLGVNQVGSVLQLFWGVDGPVTDYAEACRSDRDTVARIAESTLVQHQLVHPRGLILLSAAHTEDDIDRLIASFAIAVERGKS